MSWAKLLADNRVTSNLAHEYRTVPERTCNMPETLYRDGALKFRPHRGLDYQWVTDMVGLTNDDLSRVGQVAKSRVRLDERAPPALRERLEQIANCFLQVTEHFNGNGQKASLWFKITNPMLGHISPRDMIRYGRLSKLQRLVTSALSESRQIEPYEKST